MLSIDYRQKVFLRDITNLEKTSVQELSELNNALDQVVQAMTQLKDNILDLHEGIEKSKEDLTTEIAKEDAYVEAVQRQVAEEVALEDARRHEHEQEARDSIEEYLGILKGQAD